MNKDYYKTLNINRDSSQDDIKKSFRNLSKQYHPDKGGNEAKFKEISEAYDTLSNPEKKRQYDMGGQNPFGGHHPFGNHEGPGMEDLFNQFFNNRGQRQQHTLKGKTLNIPLRVDLEDVFFGKTKTLKYQRNINCESCNGAGGGFKRCEPCGGRGFTERTVGNAFFKQVHRHTCVVCNGGGKIRITTCQVCDGAAGKRENSVIDFKVPYELMSGQKYVFRGLGNEVHNGMAGDLTIEVVINRHQHFTVTGKDLLYQPEVSILDILLGRTITIPYFGNVLNIDIPPYTQIGKKFSLKGKGMRRTREYPGSLIVQPKVIIPTQLSESNREMIIKLSQSEDFKIKK